MTYKYEEIADALRQNIRNSRYGPYGHGRLPLQIDLAAEFRVGLATVHRAVTVLKQEGLVYTTHEGTFIGAAHSGPWVLADAGERS